MHSQEKGFHLQNESECWPFVPSRGKKHNKRKLRLRRMDKVYEVHSQKYATITSWERACIQPQHSDGSELAKGLQPTLLNIESTSKNIFSNYGTHLWKITLYHCNISSCILRTQVPQLTWATKYPVAKFIVLGKIIIMGYH